MPVGCVIVRDGSIVAGGGNKTNATRNVRKVWTRYRRVSIPRRSVFITGPRTSPAGHAAC